MKSPFPLASHGLARSGLALSLICGLGIFLGCAPNLSADASSAFPGTEPLKIEGDIASQLVDGADRFLLRQLQESQARRERHWQRDFSSPEHYSASLEPNRRQLAHILGVRDPRTAFTGLAWVARTDRPALLGETDFCRIHAVRWPAFGDVYGEGLLLTPIGREAFATVIAIPDADQTPEALAGLTKDVPAESQFARRLAESGCRVIVPVLIDRHLEKRNGRANLTNREFIYRSAFELGRHIVGYEVQKVLALVDWLEAEAEHPVAVLGYGEGGLIALTAGALDTRIDAVGVSGFFSSRQNVWQEPIDRNVFGFLDQFGDAELASMVAPRPLIVEAALGPELDLPGQGGAPAALRSPPLPIVRQELNRARQLVSKLNPQPVLELVANQDGRGLFGSSDTLQLLLNQLLPNANLVPTSDTPVPLVADLEIETRQRRQLHELDHHNQWLLRESSYVREEFMKDLQTESLPAYRDSVQSYRRIFRDDVIGHFEQALLPARPRSRQVYNEATWTGYEVTLDVWPDVIAYGLLLWPKDMNAEEKRPVVVCQHGLEGRPRDLVAGDHRAYHNFAARLAELGFIVFAPQNPYIFTDRFRTLQRKANPLGKTLFSIITPQHRQILAWLKSLPNVDPERIAFYGLSYGGKTAMRVPALLTDYCLSICSADFNEWVWKNASTRSPYSYVWTGEYEIFEFDLGSTFNYAEMAALIAPRPFMVERGHFDGVAPDDKVAHEFAKVRHLYAARLKIPERCKIEWFDGPHTIHGQGTFDFLRRQLDWPP